MHFARRQVVEQLQDLRIAKGVEAYPRSQPSSLYCSSAVGNGSSLFSSNSSPLTSPGPARHQTAKIEEAWFIHVKRIRVLLASEFALCLRIKTACLKRLAVEQKTLKLCVFECWSPQDSETADFIQQWFRSSLNGDSTADPISLSIKSFLSDARLSLTTASPWASSP